VRVAARDDLVFIVLDAVAALGLGVFRRRYRADGHGRAAFDPEMMVALLLYGYCQGERCGRVSVLWDSYQLVSLQRMALAASPSQYYCGGPRPS
jgi:hypothetical protein